MSVDAGAPGGERSLDGSLQLPGDLSQSYSVNTVTSIRPDQYVISDGSDTNPRRFFSLFVTFDLMFTCLMWLICIMLNGDNIMTALKKQIYHYDVHTSLFDIVTVALCRFLLLLFFYTLLTVNHWFVIALSTATSSLFLISKVFVYDWQSSNQPVFQVLLVLISFVLSWGEAWLLDFRVNTRQFLITSPDSERAPLIRSYVQGLPSMYTESVGNFYSPLGTPEGSVCEEAQGLSSEKFAQVEYTYEQKSEIKDTVTKDMNKGWRLLNEDDWKLVKKSKDNDIVYAKTVPNVGKVFCVRGSVEKSARFVLKELFYNVEKHSVWNANVLETHRVQVIDEITDIIYQVCKEAAGGALSSRDFVILRHCGVVDDCFVISSSPVEHPSVGENNKYIRGEIPIGCIILRPHQNDPDTCTFEFMITTKLNGWVPQYVVDMAHSTMLLDYIESLRQHLKKHK